MPRPASRPVPTRRSRTRPDAAAVIRREAIVQAAVRIFSRKGFQKARAEDIAHAAHIAKGTLYLYFRSKESLYSAVIARAVGEMQGLVDERTGAARCFREKLRAAIEVRLHFWTEHEELYRLLLTLGREAKHRRQTLDLLQSGQQHLLAIFTEGAAKGDVPERNYEALAWAVLDMVRGAAERRMDRVAAWPVEEDAAAITRFALTAATG